MKKIAILLSAVVAGTMAQAVAVGWTVSNLKFDTNVSVASGVGYFFIVGSTAMGEKTYNDIIDLAKAGKDVSTYASGQTTIDLNANNGKAGANAASSGITAADNSSFDWFVLVYDNATSPANYIATTAANKTTKTSAVSVSVNASTVSGGWQAVPEPTTVALLALGLAAVGLKRKVA